MNPILEKKKEKEEELGTAKPTPIIKKKVIPVPSVGKKAPPPPAIKKPVLKPLGTLPTKSISGGKSLYSFSIPSNATVTPKQAAIMKKSGKIEDLSQEDLREVYFFIDALPGKRLYGASAVNEIDRKGRHPENSVPDESDSLFIGTQVHLAMETKGASISNLKSWDMFISKDPKKPNVSISPDHWKMIEYMEANETTAIVAYHEIKDNTTTKAISRLDLMQCIAGSITDKAKLKAYQKVTDAATKEYDKFSSVYNEVYQYYRQIRRNDQAKDKFREKEGTIIVDDVEGRRMGARAIIEKIKKCYEALSHNEEVITMYQHMYKDAAQRKGVKSYTELIVLWSYEYKAGRVVACKSMFDRVHVDFDNKLICNIDIKTHSKRAMAFASTNYIEYRYYRAMAVYEAALGEYLKSIGEDPKEWQFLSILAPVSTQTYEVGAYDPYCVVSPLDIQMGTKGSFCKPFGTIFNEDGHLQYAVDKDKFDKLVEFGFLHEHAYDYYVKGWQEIIKDYEEKNLPLKSK